MNFYTTILGSGAAIPTLARHCSAQVVNLNGFRMLLDCGEGTQNQMRVFRQKLQSIPWVFITHLHGDHLYGLPGMLSTMHLVGRTDPVDIVAPKGIADALTPLLEISGAHVEFELRYHELEGDGLQLVYDGPRATVQAFPLKHSIPTYGYLITEKPRSMRGVPRSYAYCSDTGYTEEILPYIHGVNLLCLECTFSNEFESVANEKGHLTASQAATLAQKAEAKQLLLTHFSARYKDVQPLLDQAHTIFPNTISAEDGLKVPVEFL